MNPIRPLRWLGFALLGMVVLSIGTRPAIQAQQAASAISPAIIGGAFGGATHQDPEPTTKVVVAPTRMMTVAESKVRLKLLEKIPVSFPTDTPLADLLNYVRQATISKDDFPDGVPIYVDPIGLQDADKTEADTIKIDLKGIPLATTLKLALAQLSLVYYVNPDGLLIVTNSISDDFPGNLDEKILEKLSSMQVALSDLQDEVRLLRAIARPVMMGSVGGSISDIPKSK